MLFPIVMRTIISRINAMRAKAPCGPIMFELCGVSAPGDKAQLRADEAPRGARDQREGVLIAPQDLIRKAS